jgi:Tfp pilus assembly PilM family ATPase
VNTPSWLTPAPPTIAIEIAARRVTVVEVSRAGGRTTVVRHASEGLPDGAVLPGLAPGNIPAPDVLTSAIERACLKAGTGIPSRAALVVPDSAARVTLVTLDQVPSRAAELDQLLRWQLKKSTPFPIETAQVSHFPAGSDGPSAAIATTVMRGEVVREYEQVLERLGIQPGLVDLASFNVMNAVIGGGMAPAADWLLVHLAADATTLAILRGSVLMFYRHRTALDEEPLGVLVHQTAMYHEDRLGGGAFAGAWVSGAGPSTDAARQEVTLRLGIPATHVDARSAAAMAEGSPSAVEQLDAIAASVGVLVREQAA